MSDLETVSPEPAGDVINIEQWQRISPLSIIHYIVSGVVNFLKQGVQNLLPLVPIILVAGEKRGLIISLVAIAGTVLAVTAAVMMYLKFRYRLSEGQVHIQSGVLKRKRLHLGFDRIQNVAFQQPLYFRPFKLVSVKIESAGSSGEEVKLAGVPRPLAEKIRSRVLYEPVHKQSALSLEEASEQALRDIKEDIKPRQSDQKTLIRLPVAELVRHGLSSYNILIMFGAIVGVFSQFKAWEMIAFEWLREVGQAQFGHLAYGMVLFGVLVVLTVLIILVLASVISAIISQYDFRLSQSADRRFHTTRGLFERHETSMREGKIQYVIFTQNLIARFLKRWYISLKQISFGKIEDAPSGQDQTSIEVPVAPDSFMIHLQKLIYPDFTRPEEFSRISPRYILKSVVLYFSLPTLFFTTLITWKKGLPYGLIPVLLPVIMTFFLSLRWWRYGYARDEKHGYLRSGMFGVSYTLVPFYKAQGVKIKRSYGQRRSGHATLTIMMAGKKLTVPYMAYDDALIWRDRILYEIESTDKGFM